MSKLNNSRILLAIVLLAVFVIFTLLSITLLSQKYFTNSKYIGTEHFQNELYSGKSRITIKFNNYGQLQITTNTTSTIGNERYVNYGTYEFKDYSNYKGNDIKSYFESNYLNGRLYYRNAFQLEHGDVIYTNISAICSLTFYLLMSIGSLTCAIVLLVRRKNGKKVFCNIAHMQAQIDELQKQIDELKNE